MTKYRGIQVVVVVGLYLVFAHLLPLVVHQLFFTCSLLIKDVLMWLLPLTVSLFIAHAISGFKQRAPLFILALILFETLSNLSSVWYAYLGGNLAVDALPSLQAVAMTDTFEPLWRLSLHKPSWWSADKGAMVGAVVGVIAAFIKRLHVQQLIDRGKKMAEIVLTQFFSRLIPLFVLGFVARMVQMKFFQQIVSHYALLLIWLVVLLMIYLVTLFAIGSGFRGALQAIKNLLPAGGIAFTSGCSISTMPWTIDGTSKNLQSPDLAKAIVPATTNIQQIGDCITNSFLCFLLYTHFFGHAPDIKMWLTFSTMFVLARFATAAVLGGAIFVMLPIYESYLAFSPEMIAIILAFNVILDPLVTSSNVIGNGALCRIFERGWRVVTKLPLLNLPKSDRTVE